METMKVVLKYILIPIIFVLLFITMIFMCQDEIEGYFFGDIKKAVVLGSPNYSYTDEYLGSEEIKLGSQYGLLFSKNSNLKAPLYYGDSDAELQKGVGNYQFSGKPGEGRTVLIGGHDISYFATLENVKIKDIIEVDTSYGHFKYKVSEINVEKANNLEASKLSSNREILVLYTCYPFGKVLGDRPDRFFVYATPYGKEGVE